MKPRLLNFATAVMLLSSLEVSQAADESQGAVTRSDRSQTNRVLYAVRAGGPASYVGLTNAPDSNAAKVSFVDWEQFDPPIAVLRITNGEPCSILVWNIRVQVRSTGRGTDGFGWDTVLDEFPFGDLKTWHKPNETGEFSVKLSGQAPWRVCLIYAKEPAKKSPESRVSAVGNYEVISQEIRARK